MITLHDTGGLYVHVHLQVLDFRVDVIMGLEMEMEIDRNANEFDMRESILRFSSIFRWCFDIGIWMNRSYLIVRMRTRTLYSFGDVESGWRGVTW